MNLYYSKNNLFEQGITDSKQLYDFIEKQEEKSVSKISLEIDEDILNQKIFNRFSKIIIEEGEIYIKIVPFNKKILSYLKFSGFQVKDTKESEVFAFKKVWKKNKVKIDEDKLLNQDNVEKKEVDDDCSSKPKACKNCSCGRKEMEDEMTQEELDNLRKNPNFKSSCGSCYLGDAFRCSSCPYKGLPSFLPGEKVKLDINNDLNIIKEENTKITDDGKVKLDL